MGEEEKGKGGRPLTDGDSPLGRPWPCTAPDCTALDARTGGHWVLGRHSLDWVDWDLLTGAGPFPFSHLFPPPPHQPSLRPLTTHFKVHLPASFPCPLLHCRHRDSFPSPRPSHHAKSSHTVSFILLPTFTSTLRHLTTTNPPKWKVCQAQIPCLDCFRTPKSCPRVWRQFAPFHSSPLRRTSANLQFPSQRRSLPSLSTMGKTVILPALTDSLELLSWRTPQSAWSRRTQCALRYGEHNFKRELYELTQSQFGYVQGRFRR